MKPKLYHSLSKKFVPMSCVEQKRLHNLIQDYAPSGDSADDV